MREFQADGRTISAYLAVPEQGSGPAVRVLRQHTATHLAAGRGKLALVGFSLGGAYALDLSVTLAQDIAAVVTFYASYPGLDYRGAQAAYLCHFAQDDPFESAESVAQMEQELQAAGRSATFYSRVSRYFSTLLRISDATVSFRHPATRISAPSIGPVVNPNGILASIPEGSWCICASSWHRSPESCLEHRPVAWLD